VEEEYEEVEEEEMEKWRSKEEEVGKSIDA
jgi:hypothetical protein